MKYRATHLLFTAPILLIPVLSLQGQIPIMTSTPNTGLGPAIPRPPQNTPASPSDPTQPPSGGVILSDVLGNDRSINIFAGFTRDFAPISERFDDASLNTTILAPVNSAIMALPLKPWEDPEDYKEAGEAVYDEEGGEEKAQRNLRGFVERHVVPISPWKEGEKVKTLAGGEVWWETKEGKKVIQPGDIEVSSVASQVHNGEVWILKGVRDSK